MEIKIVVAIDPAIAAAFAAVFAPLFKSIQPKPGVAPADLNVLEARVMSKIAEVTAELDAVKKSEADATARVTAWEADLTAKADALKAQVDALTTQLKDADIPPEVMASLEEIKTGLDGINKAPDVPVVTPPTP